MTSYTVGESWTYTVNLCRQLATENISVVLATLGRHLSPAQRKQVLDIPGLIVFESDYKLEWMDDPWPDIEEAGNWLLQLEVAYQPGIIHLNSFAFGSLPFKAPILMMCHSDVYSRWLNVYGELPPNDSSRFYYELVYNGLHSADTVVAVSKAYRQMIVLTYKLDPSCIQVIYNGLMSDSFNADQKKEIIVSSGNICDDAKQFQLLDNIAVDLPAPVEIAGITDPTSVTKPVVYNNLIVHNDLSNDKLSLFLSQAAIFALPTLYEPSGISLLEAAFSGCALVLSDIDSLREIWRDSAIYAAPDDPAAWTRILRNLINDPSLRNRMASAAYLRAFEYTIQNTGKQYVSLYNKMSLTKLSYV